MRIKLVGQRKQEIFHIAMIWSRDDRYAARFEQIEHRTRVLSRPEAMLDYFEAHHDRKCPVGPRKIVVSGPKREIHAGRVAPRDADAGLRRIYAGHLISELAQHRGRCAI